MLDGLAARVNPLLSTSLKELWVTAQAEYSTEPAGAGGSCSPVATLTLGAKSVMGFLGKELKPTFQGEMTTDFRSFLLDGRRRKGVAASTV